jgi:hypothetical protein
MKLSSRIALVLLLLPTLLIAQTKKKHTVPAIFNNARYVWVETIDGRDVFSPGLNPDDRQAISDVEDALRDWKRYSLTTQRSEAELVFVVRKGRLVAAKIGGTAGGGSGPRPQPFPGQRPVTGPDAAGTADSAPGVMVGAEAGSPDDLLQVRVLNTDGRLGAVLWERMFPDGLDAPQVSLVAQLKKAVEHDYPLNPLPSTQTP